MMEPLLVLQHKDYPTHIEEWFRVSKSVYVRYDTPHNFPPKGEATMSVPQAMRQFILMVSDEEGWKVKKDHGWRNFVMDFEEVK